MSNPFLGSTNNKLTGLFNCFVGSGGFSMEKGYENIENVNELDASFAQFDVTNAVQVLLDAKVLNEKIGLYKNNNNNVITSSSFNNTTNLFPTNSITISSNDFQTALLSQSQIINVGAHSNINTGFENYIKSYFGFFGDNSSLFTSIIDYDSVEFKEPQLYELFKTYSGVTASGEYINNLSGFITINNINIMLKLAENIHVNI